MTETATSEVAAEQRRTQVRAALTTGGTVNAIVPTDVDQAHRMAQMIVTAQMAPKSYDGSVERVMVGILHGMEVGFTPMAALQSIAVINGMPTIWGDGALGLVTASGLLEDINEEQILDEAGRLLACKCTVKRKGRPTPTVRSFSNADAKQAGLLGKRGPWTEYPQRMMQMRARSWALRDGFPDVLRGLAITEEARDMGALTVDADGVYTPEPDTPRPNRADYVEAGPSADVAERATAIADSEGVSPDEALRRAEEETKEPEPAEASEPQAAGGEGATSDAPAAAQDSQGAVETIAVPKNDAGETDYFGWAHLVVKAIKAAPESDAWCNAFEAAHADILNKMENAEPKQHIKVMRALAAKRPGAQAAE